MAILALELSGLVRRRVIARIGVERLAAVEAADVADPDRRRAVFQSFLFDDFGIDHVDSFGTGGVLDSALTAGERQHHEHQGQ